MAEAAVKEGVVETTDTTTQADDSATTDTTVDDTTVLDTKDGTDATDGAADTVAATGDDKPAWREDWRAALAKGDETRLAALDRFTSIDALADSLFEAQKKLRSRKPTIPEKPGEGATEEDVAAYRKALGVPETPEGYLEDAALPDGWVMGDDDKAVAQTFAERMHKAHASPEYVKEALAWYRERQEEVQAEELAADRDFKTASRDALRDEWGAKDFNDNLQFVAMLFEDKAGEGGLFDKVHGGRTNEGRRFGDDPEVLKWMASISRQLNGDVPSLVPNGRGALVAGADRLKEIEKMRSENYDAYIADKAIQAEELKLIDDDLKRQKRATR